MNADLSNPWVLALLCLASSIFGYYLARVIFLYPDERRPSRRDPWLETEITTSRHRTWRNAGQGVLIRREAERHRYKKRIVHDDKSCGNSHHWPPDDFHFCGGVINKSERRRILKRKP
ncbi:MAG TPA: hypothetical protein PLP58_22755, partial [Prosthecobacter sp.]|nr:hypothetical protein [Prosthecobacter sp.]